MVLQYNSANRTSPNTLVTPITHTTSTLPIVVPIAEKKDFSGKLILDGNVLPENITCVSRARLSDYDKLQYIEKLKNNRNLLQTDLDSKEQQLDKFQELLDTYHFQIFII